MVALTPRKLPPFQPFGGYVLVKEIPRTETTGGIALPDGQDTLDEPPLAVVIAVGPGEETETGHIRQVPVKPGDTIFLYFPSFATPVGLTIEGERYALVQAKYICGRMRT